MKMNNNNNNNKKEKREFFFFILLQNLIRFLCLEKVGRLAMQYIHWMSCCQTSNLYNNNDHLCCTFIYHLIKMAQSKLSMVQVIIIVISKWVFAVGLSTYTHKFTHKSVWILLFPSWLAHLTTLLVFFF